jgi:hypothetical protein
MRKSSPHSTARRGAQSRVQPDRPSNLSQIVAVGTNANNREMNLAATHCLPLEPASLCAAQNKSQFQRTIPEGGPREHAFK